MDSSYHTPPAHPSSPGPTTHLPLTPPPSSPEASEASSSGAPVTKRVPRVYPFASDPSSSKPQQQFSRSARKRDSVLALSSIDHLSHHFTKLSAVGEQDSGSDAEVKGARRGPLKLSINGRDGGGSSGKARVDLPPTPARPTQSSLRSPFPLPSGVKLEPDWTTTIGDLKSVERVLGLGAGVKTAAEPIDVLDVIKTTTASLRSVRDLLVAVPEGDLPGPSRVAAPSTSPSPPISSSSILLASSHLPHQAFSTPSRPSYSGSRLSTTRPASSGRPTLPSSVDPLTRIRKVTLDVLSALRLLEEQHRLQEEEPETSKEESTVPATSLDPITESPRSSLDSSRSETLEDRRPWEDRLGHLYHSNVTPSDSRSLQAVRKEVERYLREVNVVMFDGQGWSASDRAPANRRRGSQRHDAFSTLGIEEEAKGSLDIPLGSWMNKGLDLQERISDLISSLDIPRTSGSGSHLATPTKSSDGLRFLTDGQVLCQAYNRVVRRSRRPFGFIPEHKIHDFGTDQRPPSVALSPESIKRRQSVEGESKQPRDYAFRRIENMREFAAAVKLRYLVPIVPPGTFNPQPSSVVFSAPQVAKQDPGWEGMLEGILRCWLNRLTDEEDQEERRLRVELGE